MHYQWIFTNIIDAINPSHKVEGARWRKRFRYQQFGTYTDQTAQTPTEKRRHDGTDPVWAILCASTLGTFPKQSVRASDVAHVGLQHRACGLRNSAGSPKTTLVGFETMPVELQNNAFVRLSSDCSNACNLRSGTSGR